MHSVFVFISPTRVADASSARQSSYRSWHVNKKKKCVLNLLLPRLVFKQKSQKIKYIERELHITFCSILMYGGMVNYMHRSLKHTDIEEKTTAWRCSNCDRQTTNSLQMHSDRCHLHKNTFTAELDSDLATTENLSRFLSWSPRVKIILYVSLNCTRSTVRNHDVVLESAEVAVFVAQELLQETVYRSNGTPF